MKNNNINLNLRSIKLIFIVLLSQLVNAQNPFLDPDFNAGSGFNQNGQVYASALLGDATILVAGTFGSYNGTTRLQMARIRLDGVLRTDFVPLGFNGVPRKILVQNDGKYIVCGFFTQYGTNVARRIVRINADGSIDNTFNTGTGFDEGVYDMTFTSNNDGKIVVVGHFLNYNGTAVNGVAKLNPDGSLDNTFNVGSGPAGSDIQCIERATSPAGKFYIGGSFTTFNGTNRNYIARLNADGSLDNTFNPGTGFNAFVSKIKNISGGKIIVGGNFTAYQTFSCTRIAQLDNSGAYDVTFTTGTGFSGVINDIIVDPFTQKTIIGGAFTAFNNNAHNRIVRLNTDGSLDTTFNALTGFNGEVRTLARFDYVGNLNGKILVGGNFLGYNGANNARKIAVLTGSSVLDAENFEKNKVTLYPNPVVDEFVLETDLNLEKLEIYNLSGQKVFESNQSINNISHLKSGLYMVKVIHNNGHHVFEKIVKK